MSIVLDIWTLPKAISFGRKSSDVVAVVTTTGSGAADASGDPVPGSPTASAKYASALRFPAFLTAVIRLTFQAGSAEDGSAPAVTFDELPIFHQTRFDPKTGTAGYVFGDQLYAEAVAALPTGITASGPNLVSVYPIGDQKPDGTGGRWGVDFISEGMTLPGFVDLVKSSHVVMVAPAPPSPQTVPPQPVSPPNQVIFNIDATVSDPAEVANSNTVTVDGYTQQLPTPQSPNPPQMSFKANADGTISVTGGTLLWTFSQSQPDLIAYPIGTSPAPKPTFVAFKFNSKGPVS